MKAVAVTCCLLCFQFEALYVQPHVSDAQVVVEFENGNFNFTFPNPKNVSEFSMTLFKGHEKKEICAFHLSQERVIPKSNVTYCETQHSRTSTTFILKNLEKNHIDVYTYDLEIFLPPPYIDCCLKETYLYIQGK
ncbi:ICOS protein, partial [Horornis vulcanius]|nr:ICOS protein [Horornis vulcanius]